VNLLFIKHKNFNARTVENDVQILEEDFSVNMYEVNTGKSIGFFFALIKEFYYLLFILPKHKIVFIWFADYHSLLPVFFCRLYGKKVVINIGGYDADEILIGNPVSLKEKFRKFCVSYSVRHADLLLPVSNVIKKYLETAVSREKCITAFCCIDTKKFQVSENINEKENLVITVGGGGEFEKEAIRKRLDYFIELGNEFNKRYPQYNTKFYAIGHNKNSSTYNYLAKLIESSGVKVKPMTNSIEELIEYYKKASVYMQLSYYEAFGIAQIEAMLYGCIPVSNNGGAIADVVADAGFIIENYDNEKYLLTIKNILEKKHESLREKAKQRVLENFTIEVRRNTILPALKKLLE
jgi:glycosyltransferase involved in cell wall biosynthesis